MASPLDDLQPSQLKALLEDCQASLAASLARIEAYRIRERHILEELSALRTAVHGGAPASAPAAAGKGSSKGPVLAPGSEPPNQGLGSKKSSYSSLGTCSIPVPQAGNMPGPYTSISGDSPLYVCSVEGGEHAVALVANGKKVNCSMIIAKDHIDFVTLQARVHQTEFMGISSSKESKAQGPTLSAGGASAGGSAGTAGGLAPEDADAVAAAAAAAAAAGTAGGSGGGAAPTGPGRGIWEFHLRTGPATRTIKFEASQSTRTALHRHTERWLGNPDAGEAEGDEAGMDPGGVDAHALAQPKPLLSGPSELRLAGGSQVMQAEHVKALAGALPPLERLRQWGLAYSTKVHGISLATLYRKMNTSMPAITVIKDTAGHIFGCYTAEGWHVAPRFYGSGETFVFQLEPHRLQWTWRASMRVKNDFFQYSTPDCLALGGLGHFAIHVDSDLLQGSSGTCGTFGSPCLAGADDFKVLAMEVWQPTS